MSPRYQQLMQEKLDGQLDEAKAAELWEYLQDDHDAAAAHAQLEALHQLLEHTPAMRAPKRLAVTIMARLSQYVEAEAQAQKLPEELRLGVMLSTAIVSIAMMPTMLAASQMVLVAQRDPRVLLNATYQSIALVKVMIDGLLVLMDEIEQEIRHDPEKAPMMMRLIPVALLSILDYVEEETSELREKMAEDDRT